MMLLDKDLITQLQHSNTFIKATATFIIADILYNQSHTLPINTLLLTRFVAPFVLCFFANRFSKLIIEDCHVKDPSDPIYKLPAFSLMCAYFFWFMGLENNNAKWVNYMCIGQALLNFHWLYRPIRRADLKCTNAVFDILKSGFSFGDTWDNPLSECFSDLTTKCQKESDELKQKIVYPVSDNKRVKFTLFTCIEFALFNYTQDAMYTMKLVGLCFCSMIFENILNAIIYPKSEQSNGL